MTASRPKANHILVQDTNFERTAWLESLRHTFRRMCLDERQSVIWNYVDREKFAAATSGQENTEALAQNAKALFLIATLYFYNRQSNS